VPTITVPAAAVANASGSSFAGADQVFEPESASATGSGPTPSVTTGSFNLLAAVANATAGLSRVGIEVGPTAAVAAATGPSSVVNPPVTITPAAAIATARASNVWLLSDFFCGEYSAGFYGAGFYGICSVVEMSLFATTWDLAYTTDDASDPTPTWITIDQEDVRSVDVARGRDDELGRVDAGTAQIVLNNRTRSFDPQVVSGLRPMNRWRVRAIHNAVTYDVFLGYAESYEQSWPALGFDAITTVRLVDEFKLLALQALPTMNPDTAQSYADVVRFDDPQGYWQFQDFAELRVMQPTVGGVLFTSGSVGRATSGVVGDGAAENITGTVYGARSTAESLRTVEDLDLGTFGLPVGGPGDIDGLSAFTIELWFKTSEFPVAATRAIFAGPLSGGSLYQWDLTLQTSGLVRGVVRNSGGTAYTVDSTSTVPTNTWVHIALVVSSPNTWLYINGALEDTASWSGAGGVMDAGGFLQLGTTTAVGGTRFFDEPAFYRYALTSERIIAHYEAGALRGFPEQTTGGRIDDILNAIGYGGTINIDSGTRDMTPTFQHGQSALEAIRAAEQAEQVDGFFFINQQGEPTFLEDGHRSSGPYASVQATFDDDGTDLPYRDLTLDYSETFLYNEINVSRTGGELVTDEDATSVSAYGTRTLAATELQLTDDADVTAIATALVAKYKDPFQRITSLGVFLYDTVSISEVLSLDLGYRVRIFRTHPAGGARIDQTAFVQRIQLSSRPGQPITVTLGVSPL
jgi:hypothetical protein